MSRQSLKAVHSSPAIAVPVGAWDEWAQRIAGRRRDLRVLDDEGAYRTRSWPSSQPDVAWAVHLHDDEGRARTLAIDIDCKDGHELDAHRQADAVASLLELAQLHYVRARSGPTGGIHLYVPLATAWPAQALHSIVRELRAVAAPRVDPSPHSNAKTGAIRGPGSPHPSGTDAVTILGRLDRARDAFDTPNGDDALRELARLLGVPLRGELPQSWWTNLLTGAKDLTGGEAVKSEQRRSLLRVAHLHGFTEEWLRALLKRHNSPHAARLLEKRPGGDFLKQEWKRIVQDPSAGRTMTPDERHVWMQLVQLLEPDLWSKHNDCRDVSLLRVLLGHAWQHQRLELDLSTRTLGTAMGASRNTASLVLGRVEARGWIARERAPRARDASTIRLLPLSGEGQDTGRTARPQPTAVGELRGVPSFTTPDSPPATDTPELFWSRVGGIGPRAQHVLALIGTKPDSATGLAQRLQLKDARSLRRTHLANLMDLDLIGRTTEGVYYALPTSERELRRHAFEQGALRGAQARRKRVEDERLDYSDDRRRGFVLDVQARIATDAIEWTNVDALRQRYNVKSVQLFAEAVDAMELDGRLHRDGDRVRATGTRSRPLLQLAIDPSSSIPLEQVALEVEAKLTSSPQTVAALAALTRHRTKTVADALEHLQYNGRVLRSGRVWSAPPATLPLTHIDADLAPAASSVLPAGSGLVLA